MKKDTMDFLSTLLWTAETENPAARDATVYDFGDAFIAGAEAFVEGFRAHLERSGFDMSLVDEGAAERSFGGSVYLSLSGHGAGFFDERAEEVAALHEVLKAWAGAGRFEGLDGMIEDDGAGKLDLCYLPEYIDEKRSLLFAVPKEKEVGDVQAG